jgi:hypothetical protein
MDYLKKVMEEKIPKKFLKSNLKVKKLNQKLIKSKKNDSEYLLNR